MVSAAGQNLAVVSTVYTCPERHYPSPKYPENSIEQIERKL